MKVPVEDLRQGMVLVNGHTVQAVVRSGRDTVIIDTTDRHGDMHEELEAVGTQYEVEAIDITPTWSALLPVFIGVLQNPKASVSAQKQAEANLYGMAQLADKFVDLVKRGSNDTVGLTPVLTDPDAPEGRA